MRVPRSLGADLDVLRSEAVKRLKGEAEVDAPKKKKAVRTQPWRIH
jgi:hypothetical protein